MNIKQTIAIALASTAFIYACKNKGGFDKTESGLQYQFVVENKDAKKANYGDLITIDVAYKTETDSVLFNSAKAGKPIKVQLREPVFKGSLEEGFKMMGIGDSALFKVVADSFFVKFLGAPLPKEIKPGSFLTFNVKMKEIKAKVEFEKEQQVLMQQQQHMMDSLKETEGEQLKKYLAENKITQKATASGLIFISKKAGKGTQAVKGKKVKVNYTGTLLDGTMFDTSVKEDAQKGNILDPNRPYDPIEFELGVGQVIPGWDEAIALMKVGEKATIIIPSTIAYGPNGAGPIPPFSSLRFDVELIDVK